jgi:hypothetical protein
LGAAAGIRPIVVAFSAAALALAGPWFEGSVSLGATTLVSQGAYLAPGSAPGGQRSVPESQITADIANISQSCSDNSVLIFSFRGSGAHYGKVSGAGADNMIKWAEAAKRGLIARGYRVRELQAIYPALPVPGVFFSRPSTWFRYRDSILATQNAVRETLTQAYLRCPQRKIVIGAYSSGAILAGRVIPPILAGRVIRGLPRGAISQIKSVDLIADPSALRAVDTFMQKPKGLDGRSTLMGAYTRWVGSRAYPTILQPRMAIYCRVPDAVCNWKSTAVIDLALQIRNHSLYQWTKIGERAARQLPVRQPPPPPLVPPPPPAIAGRHISQYTTTPDLACTLQTQEDTADEFYNGLFTYSNDACGTFLVVDGVLYAPGLVPAGSNLGAPTPWTPVAQQTTGTGTAADPYVEETTVAAGSTGIQLDQTDRWVFGGSTVDSTFTLTSTAGDARAVQLYRAADCYVGNSDVGTGTYDAATNSPGCLRVQSDGTIVDELLLPLTPGATSVEDYFASVWSDVGAQGPLPNSCQCSASIDNGFATSWLLDLNGSNPVTAASRFAFAQPSP